MKLPHAIDSDKIAVILLGFFMGSVHEEADLVERIATAISQYLPTQDRAEFLRLALRPTRGI
jgi:hypothetical protein